MKKYRQVFLFVLLCGLLMSMLSQSVTANAQECSAKSAIVIDSVTGDVLYESNAYERLPMASTTKIMTALIALESGQLDSEFTVDSEAIKVEGSSMGLEEGDRVTMRTLVCGMLLPSGNDAANAAAVKISGSIDDFVKLMNERAQEMGLENTHFVTPSGLDDYTDDHYSTAYDMARLAAEAMKNDDFAAICSQRTIKVSFGNPPYERWLTNSNKLLDSCEGVIGVKTGFTDKARRCLVSACERDGATLICVTLNDPDDWQDHSALYDYAFQKLTDVKMPESDCEFTVRVAGAEKAFVKAKSDALVMRIPIGVQDKIETCVCIKPFLFAPVTDGDEVGEIKYYYRGTLFASLKIKAAESASAAQYKGGWEGFLKMLEKYVQDN